MAKNETYEIYFVLNSPLGFSKWEIYMPEDEAILGMNGAECYYYEKIGFYWERKSSHSLIEDFDRLKNNFTILRKSNKLYRKTEGKEEAILNLNKVAYEHLKGNILVVIESLKKIENFIHTHPEGLKLTFEKLKSYYK